MDVNGRRWWDWLWLITCGVLSTLWCITCAHQLSATFDEPIYLTRGLDVWRTGSHSGLMRLGTMPLPVDLETLPLYLHERWSGTRLDVEAEIDRWLPWARAGNLVFWWLLLLYAWLVGWSLAGRWGGWLATAFLAVEPSLLANASLATTDIAISACLLALVYHFRTYRESTWAWRILVPALLFGMGILAKASGLVFGILCMTILELERLWRRGDLTLPSFTEGRRWLKETWHKTGPLRWDLPQIVGIGIAVAVLYCGTDWRAESSFVLWAHSLQEGWVREGMIWLSENLRVFSNAGEGFVRQVKHNVLGHGTFLLGQAYPRAVWFYFPVLLTIKLSIPILLAPLVIAIVRPKSLGNWALVAAALLLVLSFNYRVQIGIRLVLPMVVLGIVGLAVGLAESCRSLRIGWQRVAMAGLIFASLGWTATESLRAWPHGLCYINGFWGGMDEGYRLVSDSNYDWGQGLKDLRAWQQEHGDETINLWYFGTDPSVRREPYRVINLHALQLGSPEDVVHHMQGRYLAVSTTLLHGMSRPTEEHTRAAEYLRTLTPAYRTATFLIYDMERERLCER